YFVVGSRLITCRCSPLRYGYCKVAVSLSRFGPPSAVVPVARTELAPALSVTLTEDVDQVSQFAVSGNDRPDLTTTPLTMMSIGRSAVPALEKRKSSL